MRAYPISAAIVLALIGWSSACLAADSPSVMAAKKRLADAQSELSRANASVAVIIHKARAELEATPEWRQASAQFREAEAHLANASKAARDKLRKTPEYQAAAKARAESQARRDALREQPNPPPDKMAAAAIELLNASGSVSRLETDALSADPHVSEANAKVSEARAKLDALLKTLPDLAKKDPAFDAARQHIQSASAAAEDANKQLALAKQQQDSADEQKMNQDIDTRRDQMRSITGFRR